ERGDWSIYHRHKHYLNENERRQCDRIHRAGVELHRVINRNVKDRCQEVAGHHYLLAPDSVREASEKDEQRGAERERHCNAYVGRDERNLQNGLEEEQRVELAGIPYNCLSGRGSEQNGEE